MSFTRSARDLRLLQSSLTVPVPLLVLICYSDRGAETEAKRLYFSDRPLRYAHPGVGDLWRAAVLKPAPVAHQINHLPDIDGAGSGGMQRTWGCTLRNIPTTEDWPSAANLGEYLLDYPALRIEVAELLVEVQAGEDPVDLRDLVGSEHLVRFRGDARIESRTPHELSLTAKSDTPFIPWNHHEDPATNDPRDLGARMGIGYGELKKVKCRGMEVGWLTTLAEALLLADTPSAADLTDASGLPTSGYIMIGSDCCAWTGKSGNTLTGFSQGELGTTASSHAAGDVLAELMSEIVFEVLGHEAYTFRNFYVRSPFNGQIIRVTTGYTSTTNDTASPVPSGLTCCTVRLTQQQQVDLMSEMASSAADILQQTAITQNVIDQEQAVAQNVSNQRQGVETQPEFTDGTPTYTWTKFYLTNSNDLNDGNEDRSPPNYEKNYVFSGGGGYWIEGKWVGGAPTDVCSMNIGDQSDKGRRVRAVRVGIEANLHTLGYAGGVRCAGLELPGFPSTDYQVQVWEGSTYTDTYNVQAVSSAYTCPGGTTVEDFCNPGSGWDSGPRLYFWCKDNRAGDNNDMDGWVTEGEQYIELEIIGTAAPLERITDVALDWVDFTLVALSDPATFQTVAISDAVIGGASVGFGLDCYADVDGYKVPVGATQYHDSPGARISHPADVVRHILEELCGLGTDATDDDSFDLATTNLRTGNNETSVLLNELDGRDFNRLMGRLLFEMRLQLVQHDELVALTTYRLLSCTSPGAWPATIATIEPNEYAGYSERERETWHFTRWWAVYNRDRTYDGGQGAGYTGVVRVNPDVSDLVYWNTGDVEAAETVWGRHDHPGLALMTVEHQVTAEDVVEFYVRESGRVAWLADVVGLPPWRAAGWQVGDSIIIKSPWNTDGFKGRILSVSRGWDRPGLDVVLVKV